MFVHAKYVKNGDSVSYKLILPLARNASLGRLLNIFSNNNNWL